MIDIYYRRKRLNQRMKPFNWLSSKRLLLIAIIAIYTLAVSIGAYYYVDYKEQELISKRKKLSKSYLKLQSDQKKKVEVGLKRQDFQNDWSRLLMRKEKELKGSSDINKQEFIIEWNKNYLKKDFWPEQFLEVNIHSSKDEHLQKAYYYSSKNGAKPLIVSLHSWTADYSQYDKLSALAYSKGWNYIHPNFRGSNYYSDGCCSDQVISDIDDAIKYAIEHGSVDLDNIFIIGNSGGGYTALCYLMKTKLKLRSVQAWSAPINLIEWYYQSVGRNSGRAIEIMNCTHSASSLNYKEAKKRSPLYMNTPKETIKNTDVYLIAGIHDGYIGTVPFKHSVDFFNKLALDLGARSIHHLVPDNELYDMSINRTYQPNSSPTDKLGGRQVVYKKKFKNINLLILEGNHEYLPKGGLELIESSISKSKIVK